MEGVVLGRGGASFWAGRPVLVTGCTGLLGSWLSEGLVRRGARVSGLARGAPPPGGAFHRLGLEGRVAVAQGSVTDASLLEGLFAEHSPRVVFHLAGQSQVGRARRELAETFEVNVRGTWTVLEAARGTGRLPAVVLASSAAVYADRGDAAHEEEEPLAGQAAPYGASKACAEAVGFSYYSALGLPVSVARCANLYGGGDPNPGRIVPGALEAAHRGEAPVVRSDGRARRDYLHVEDAVEGYLALAEATERPDVAGQAFNLASGEVASTLALVEAILRACGRPDLAPRVLGEASDESQVVRLSTEKARCRLGWSARLPLEAGLAATVDWHRANLLASRQTLEASS